VTFASFRVRSRGRRPWRGERREGLGGVGWLTGSRRVDTNPTPSIQIMLPMIFSER
jgi:hypothetical protein